MSLVVQISDTHVLPEGELLYGKTNTHAHLASVIEQIRAMVPAPDVVLITGDLVERPDDDCYAQFIELVDRLPVPVYVNPGNHDDPKKMLEAFEGTPYFPTTHATCQYAIDDFPFRILMLNSHADGTQLPGFPDDRLAWLTEELERTDRPALLAIHHPPMVTGIEFVDMVGAGWFAGLKEVIARHPNVRLVICGHAHMDMSGLIAHAPVYMAPSTSHQLIADRGVDIAPWFINRGAPPVLHQFIDGNFLSGSYYWPESLEGRRIDDDSGHSWETLKDYMRGNRKLTDSHL